MQYSKFNHNNYLHFVTGVKNIVDSFFPKNLILTKQTTENKKNDNSINNDNKNND